MYTDEDKGAKEGLDKFLAKVDEVGSLVQGLVNSSNEAASTDALTKADNYLKKSSKEECKVKEDRIVINKAEPQNSHTNGGESEVDMASFCRSVEEDSRERAERRKEREVRGKELKKKGNAFFKDGDFEKALECFANALQETPWDVTLHTNRALIEPATVKAYVHKANAMKALGEVMKARDYLTTALKECPEHKKDLQPYLDKLTSAS